MTLDTSVRPYFDDYNEDDQFYQILFRPSFAIQTRELNQMQTILQKQIERHGKNIFKEGAMVIPGQTFFDGFYSYVKLNPQYQGNEISSYVNLLQGDEVVLVGQTSGIRAKATFIAAETEEDPTTLYVKYITSGTVDLAEGQTKTFLPDEVILTEGLDTVYGVQVENSPEATGLGSSANIQRGVYFVNGRFVLVREQTILLDKYTNKPSYIVGLDVQEQFIEPEDDESLLDNSQGSSNFAAPGAHRYYIDLVLTKKPITDTSFKDFVELLTINEGIIESRVVNTDYSIIEETLARRTFDESGNYTVKEFALQVREHKNNDRGLWLAATQYQVGDIVKGSNGLYYVAQNTGLSGLTEPTHIIGLAPNGGVLFLQENFPQFNNGVFTSDKGGDSESLAIGLEPGKAYVFGFEVEKVSTTYIKTPKPLAEKVIRSGIVQTNIGSYCLVNNLSGALDTGDYPTVELRDAYTVTDGVAAGSVVGTAKARYIEYNSGTIGTDTGEYIISLFDVKLNSGRVFENDVKQIFFNNITGAEFTADLKRLTQTLDGAISTTSGSAAVTGQGTKFTRQLKAGQTIRFFDGATEVVRKILSIQTDVTLTLTATAPATLSNVSYARVSAELIQPNDTSLLYPFPVRNISTVRDNDNPGVANTSYHVRQTYTGVTAGNIVVISTATTNETFASAQQPDSFHVVNVSTGAVLAPTITLDPTSRSATLNFGTIADGQPIQVIATVRKVFRERSKSIVRAFSEDKLSGLTKKILLSKVDGYKLRKIAYYIVNATGLPVALGSPIPANDVTEVNITERYDFDGGQTDAVYDNAFITLKSGFANPASPIRIFYDYFEHGSSGDYFTVNSYDGFPERTPTYVSNGVTYDLRDYMDFRSSKSGGTFDNVLIPAIGYDVTADYKYLLNRVDSIVVKPDSNFYVELGQSSDDPKAPAISEGSMHLYDVAYKPTFGNFSANDYKIRKIENRRYTMQDIGKIDKRLKNVEYYTALSLIEAQTNNLQLFDANGNISFKNGFIVDPFTGTEIADVKSKDFNASINPISHELRPSFSLENVKLIEKASSNAQRLQNGYTVNRDLITLPYTEVPYISQRYASKVESIVPFLQLLWLGQIDLTPGSDEWIETQQAPEIVINEEGNFTSLLNANRDVLGTIWNSWNSTSVTTNSRTDTVTDGRVTDVIRTDTVETTNTRTGTQTFINEVFDTRLGSNNVISIEIVPFIRSRPVLFRASGLRGATRVYPFFDGLDVTDYIDYGSTFILTGKVGLFDTNTNAGNSAQQAARLFERTQDDLINVDPSRIITEVDTTEPSLSIGDVVHNGAGGLLSLATATGVAVIDDANRLTIVNVKGTFSPGQTVYGTISGARGVIDTIVNNSGLVTSNFGECAGIFNIPNNPAVRFRIGERKFALSDSPINGDVYTTRAESSYIASGTLQTRQQQIISTRNAEITRQPLFEQNIDVDDVQTRLSRTVQPEIIREIIREVRTVIVQAPPGDGGGDGGGDPLAQSFVVPSKEGCFVTSIDLFFAKKDPVVTSWFEIRQVVNGIPATQVVPGSKVVLKPTDITVSTDSSIPTKIKFPFPVYLAGESEYAVVIGSDSNVNQVWVSEVGSRDVLTAERISDQPSLGSLFKSQNASTWTPEQLLDLKFVLYRAKFSTGISTVEFENTVLPSVNLSANPIFFREGKAKARIFLKNHGMKTGDRVTISGATLFAGVPIVELNKTHTIESANFDSFVIPLTTPATTTGFGGGNRMKSTRNVHYDYAYLSAGQMTFPGTSIKHFIRNTDTAYVKNLTSIDIQPETTIAMPTSSLVASAVNQNQFMNASTKSLTTFARLISASDFVSPVLDMQRFSMTLIGSKIDAPSDSNNTLIDEISIGTGTVSFSGNRMTTSTAQSLFLNLKEGRTLTISGAGVNNGTFLIFEIAPDGTYVDFVNANFTTATNLSKTLVLNDNFVDEFVPEEGSAQAKYVIKPLQLLNPANDLRVFFDVSKKESTQIKLYYRVVENGSTANIKDVKWTLVEPINAIQSTDNKFEFKEVEYYIQPGFLYSSAQVKIVMIDANRASDPVIKQLRMIATT